MSSVSAAVLRLLPSILLSLPLGAADVPDPFAGRERIGADEIRDAAEAASPALAARRAAALAAAQRPRQAGALPDPTISYQVAPLTIGRGVEPGHVFTLTQPLPLPGVRAARAGAAAAESEAASADADEGRREVLLASARLAADYWLADHHLALARETAALASELRRAAEAGASAGAATVDALDAAQAEVDAQRDALAAERQRAEAAARIDELVGRVEDAPLPPPDALPEVLPLPDRALLLRLAERRPAAAAAAARARGRGEELALARRSRWGEVALIGGYTSMEERHREDLFVGASYTLPLDQGRRDAAVAEATAALESARLVEQAARLAARREALEAIARLEELAASLALLRDQALPAARQAAAAAHAALPGAGGVAVALRAERNRLALESRYADELAGYRRELGALECCIGLPVGRLRTAGDAGAAGGAP